MVVSGDAYLHPQLPEIWFGIVLATLTIYVALDGFDFGIGMWYATRDEEHDREQFLAAFGPVWDANEVWLVAFGTTLLGAFPSAYANLLSRHYLLAIAAVMALLLRGVAPELREQREDAAWRRTCDRLFVAGSTLSPLLLGTLVGSWTFGTGTLSLPAVLTGVVVIALSLTSGAAYLAAKTDGSLRWELARYGQLATGAYLASVVVLLAVVLALDPRGIASELLSIVPLSIVVASVGLAIVGVALARSGRHRSWFASTLGLGGLLGSLVAVVLYPSVYPATGLTVAAASVSPVALNLLTVLGVPVLLLVLGYFVYLYSVFGGTVDAEGYGE
ncbi:cytochrome d ubiquinol oxidase subunit II [Salinarchaeum laminariae]|uniref:cytochrome d ubiquinol oxidase subunit II n=1 Tax=Salinarchaeum laminariae TaxID=869888 RepID=UPI0021754904|nr:cytochrome d ubiquinol oxidase subunit II [Salinarchaeum laminariae]